MSDLRRIGMTMLPPRLPRRRQVSRVVQKTHNPSDGSPAGAASKTLWVGNLRSDVDVQQLQSEFEGFGALTNVRIVANKSRYSLTFGFVQFASLAEASLALEAKNGALVKGFRIKVQYAKNAPSDIYQPTKTILRDGRAKDEATSTRVPDNTAPSIHTTELPHSPKIVEALPDAKLPPTHKKLSVRNTNEEPPLIADAPRLVKRPHRHKGQINTEVSDTPELKDVRKDRSQDYDEERREVDSLQGFTTSETVCPPNGTGASSKTTPRVQSSSSQILEGVLSMPRKRKHSVEAGENPHDLSQKQKPSLETHAVLPSLTTPPQTKQPCNTNKPSLETRLPSSRPLAVSLPGIDFSVSAQNPSGKADLDGAKKKLKRRRLHRNIFSFGMHSDSDTNSDMSLETDESSSEGSTDDASEAPKNCVNESDEEVEVIDLTTPPGSVKAEPED